MSRFQSYHATASSTSCSQPGIASRRWLAVIIALVAAAASLTAMLPVLLHAQIPHPPVVLPHQETFRIKMPSSGLSIFLRHSPPAPATRRRGAAPVLFVHGASFPSALAAAFRFDGVSWMDDLAARGFDVWALDFLGYGESDRYSEMHDPATAHAPLGRAPEAARQIAAAVEFIARRRGAPRVSLIAHSWGTIPAGLFAGAHPERVERLVQFGPVTQRSGTPDTVAVPAYSFVTENDQRARFNGYLPKGETPVLDPRQFARWGPAYMATDPASGTRTPASVEIPNGWAPDLSDSWSGHLPYDPGKITAPVLIVRGEWDTVTPDADARWLYDALVHAGLKRDVKISRGTHVMHLEESRRQLYAEVAAFLVGQDTPPGAVVGGSSTSASPSSRTRPSTRDSTVRSLHVAGFGALTGPVRSFGINSRAALTAAADSINRTGGVRLIDGAIGRFVVSYADDRCQPNEGIALVRQFAASDALVAVGPSCSGVAEAVYHALRHTIDDAVDTVSARAEFGDSGVALPVFTDGATKAGLAQLSPWAFRNAPNEIAMYRAVWAWVRRRHPTLTTVAAGEEADFAHSHSTLENIIGPSAVAAGFRIVGTVGWSILDTSHADAARRIGAMDADVVVLSAHAAGTCSVLRELHRQDIRPALVIGLTSASSPQTLALCGTDADGLLIPTTFARSGPAADAAAAAVERAGGVADLHSMAAWEILFTLRSVMERAGVVGTWASVVADRRRLRDALARLTIMDGLLGRIARTPDRESLKPFVLVQARAGTWQIVDVPREASHR
jgi:branched-chain amino acid transport system substrate-binding protein